MEMENPTTTIDKTFPKVEPGKMIWGVSFGHPLTTTIKNKFNALIKTYQNGNQLMISHVITGKGIEPRNVHWKDYFSSVVVTYDDEKKKAYIEFHLKSRQGFRKDLMIMFLREIRNEFPGIRIGRPALRGT